MTKSCSTMTHITLYFELQRSAFDITCFASFITNQILKLKDQKLQPYQMMVSDNKKGDR